MKPLKAMVLTACAVLLAACNAGGEGHGAAVVQGPAGILANIETSNLDSDQFPWSSIADGRLKRWHYEADGLIPVNTHGNALAEAAIDEIESRLGLVIFDRDSIALIPDEDITRGLIVSEGTALGPYGMVDENTCGMVSGGVGTTAYPADFLNEQGNINTVLWVHLSSPACAASLAVAIHEFGHALGMGEHFEGFGYGDAIDANFWNVLYNIYNNNVGATRDELVITQVAF